MNPRPQRPERSAASQAALLPGRGESLAAEGFLAIRGSGLVGLLGGLVLGLGDLVGRGRRIGLRQALVEGPAAGQGELAARRRRGASSGLTSQPSAAARRARNTSALTVEEDQHRHVRQPPAALLEVQVHRDGDSAHRPDLHVEHGEVRGAGGRRRTGVTAFMPVRQTVIEVTSGPSSAAFTSSMTQVGVSRDQVTRHAVTLPKPLRRARRARHAVQQGSARCVRARCVRHTGWKPDSASRDVLHAPAQNAAEDTIAAEKASRTLEPTRRPWTSPAEAHGGRAAAFSVATVARHAQHRARGPRSRPQRRRRGLVEQAAQAPWRTCPASSPSRDPARRRRGEQGGADRREAVEVVHVAGEEGDRHRRRRRDLRVRTPEWVPPPARPRRRSSARFPIKQRRAPAPARAPACPATAAAGPRRRPDGPGSRRAPATVIPARPASRRRTRPRRRCRARGRPPARRRCRAPSRS